MAQIHPVILCGGSGTRLWPASQQRHPKPFLPLVGALSPFQEAVVRVGAVAGSKAPMIVGAAGHVEHMLEQLGAIGRTAHLVLEPEGRGTAAAVAVASLLISRSDPEGLALVVASDHHIPDTAAFSRSISAARTAAEHGWIVTFGIKPGAPSSAYGYIKPGERLGAVRMASAFLEKPDPVRAASCIADGSLWNSGNFLFSAAAMLAAMADLIPDGLAAARAALGESDRQADSPPTLLSAEFLKAPPLSFDRAVLERSERVAVIEAPYFWSDLGAWDAVWDASQKTAGGIALAGNARLYDSSDCLVRVNGPQSVAIIGASKLAVVVEEDAVLVCAFDHSQQVGELTTTTTVASPDSITPNTAASTILAKLTSRARELDLWLRTSALPLWATVGWDEGAGLFVEALDPDGRQAGDIRRLRVQARQVQVFANAGSDGWDGPWRCLVEQGLDGLRRVYRKPDGGYRTLVSPSGAILDDGSTLYDQAFVLLGLAAAHRALGGEAEELEALNLLEGPLAALRHPKGGFRETDPERPFQGNPIMHLFEASLAWTAVSTNSVWSELADALAILALERLIEPTGGYLGEFFDADWMPASGPAGRIVSPGHQYEWAWLLGRWGRARGEEAAVAAAQRLARNGRSGIDPARGVVVELIDPTVAVLNERARLWPQTERLRTSLFMARIEGEDGGAWQAEALAAARSLRAYFDTPAVGLWRDDLAPEVGSANDQAPASSLYHIAGAIAELGGLLNATKAGNAANLRKSP